MKYTEKLKRSVQSSGSVLCVGLDPNLDTLPESLNKEYSDLSERIIKFCETVIEQTEEYCAAYKPNLAFFEAIGKEGLSVLDEVIKLIPDDKVIIADAKRGDISNTADHYKKAYFDIFGADAITLSPLMGFDTLDAFNDDSSKAVYVLAMTSNQGASNFLKKPFDGFDTMGEYISYSLCKLQEQAETELGMVIGATQTSEAKAVINQFPESVLLIPGIGAQGGSPESLKELLEHHKGIPLINSSRGIIYAGNDRKDWYKEVEKSARETAGQLKAITEMYA